MSNIPRNTEKLTVLGILKEQGVKEALRVYPDYHDFIKAIKDKDPALVRADLIKKLT